MCVTMGSACPELEGEGSACPEWDGRGLRVLGGRGHCVRTCSHFHTSPLRGGYINDMSTPHRH